MFTVAPLDNNIETFLYIGIFHQYIHNVIPRLSVLFYLLTSLQSLYILNLSKITAITFDILDLTLYAKRSSDIVARYGGDEFVVLLPHTDKENAMNLAELMRIGVEEKSVPHSRSDVSDHVTISLGINTIIPSDESSIDEFINNTDKALYMAKKRRNCSVFAVNQ